MGARSSDESEMEEVEEEESEQEEEEVEVLEMVCHPDEAHWGERRSLGSPNRAVLVASVCPPVTSKFFEQTINRPKPLTCVSDY